MQVGMLAFLGPIGLPELVIIMVILILIFGANRLSDPASFCDQQLTRAPILAG